MIGGYKQHQQGDDRGGHVVVQAGDDNVLDQNKGLRLKDVRADRQLGVFREHL